MRKLFTIALLISGVTASSQSPDKIIADKIIATVGDHIILQSEIDAYKRDLSVGDEKMYSATTCSIIEQILFSRLLLIHAEKDSLPLSDEQLEMEFNRRLPQLSGIKLIEEAKNYEQVKDNFRTSLREYMLSKAMQEKITELVRITPAEVRSFFEKIPSDSLPFYETAFEIGQIIQAPKTSKDIEQYILGEMNNYKKQVEAGTTDYCQLVKLVSEDPASKDNCGEYIINRSQKNFDPVFVITSFRLKEGEISAPVKTRFGYHIIKMIERNGEDAIVRHILRIPQGSEVEIKEASLKLDSIRSAILAGNINFNTAFARNIDIPGTTPFITNAEGEMMITLDELDQVTAQLVSKMKTGEISKPQIYIDEQGRKNLRIVYLKSVKGSHRMNLQDDYSKIARLALEQKKQMAMAKWMSTALSNAAIDVGGEAVLACPSLLKLAEAK